jgi:CPA1 family monovalent cation:H+ antiporter
MESLHQLDVIILVVVVLALTTIAQKIHIPYPIFIVLIFILIGLQLGALRDAVPAEQFGRILIAGAWIGATAIMMRFMWVPLTAFIPRWLSAALRA